MIKIRAEIKKIIFRNKEDGFTIAKIYIKEHPNNVEIPTVSPIVKGYFNILNRNDDFNLTGQWIQTNRGYHFQTESATLAQPETEKGMVSFLQSVIRGVGKVTASRIVDALGDETFDIILNNHKLLTNIKGINEDKAEKIHTELLHHKHFEEVSIFLIGLGLSHSEAVNVYNIHGMNTILKVNENPYILIEETNIGFKMIDSLAKNLRVKHNNTERVKAGIIAYIVKEMNNNGDLYTLKNDILNGLNDFLKSMNVYKEEIEKEIIEKEIEKMIENNLLALEINNNMEECIYIYYYNKVENKIVEHVEEMTKGNNKREKEREVRDFIRKYQESTGFELAIRQKDAIQMVFNNKLSILTGGPGTGKSYTIDAIIRAIETIYPNKTIELASPTGKAAKRMTEMTGKTAKTIHRLIGLNNLDEEEQELIEVEADFLIVDEVSMMDAYVFYKLLTTLQPHTKLLLIGDYNQLPSVGAGLVLRDLINSSTVTVVELTEIFRQAQDSNIVMNAYKIIQGKESKELVFNSKNEDFYLIPSKSINATEKNIIRSIERFIDLGYKMEDIQVLSVMNNGVLGVNNLNNRIQSIFNPKSDDKVEVVIGASRVLRINDKVIQTENNYDIEVFNGETGTISDIKEGEKAGEVILTVDFGDRDVEYSREFIPELKLSYAITVHKSQGSEFPIVIMPYDKTLEILLNRNIIYTGTTRARDKVVFIGDVEELNKGICRIDTMSRKSRIKEKLQNDILDIEKVS